MKLIQFALILSILFAANLTLNAQNRNETGLNYALKKLSVLNKKPNWRKPTFVDEYKRDLTKAKLYFEKLQKENFAPSRLAEYQNRIKSFEMMLQMNTKQKTRTTARNPNPQNSSSGNSVTDPRMAAAIARQNEMKRKWQESQKAIWKSHKDNGIGNPTHKENIGKIRFGRYKYGGSANFINQVKAETPFSYHVFLPSSIQNLAVKEAKATNDRRWLAVTSNKLQFVISANGRVMHKWIEVSPDSLEPNTYYKGMVMTAQPIDVYGKGGFYAFYLKEVLLKNKIGGTLNIKVDVYLYNLTIRDERKPKVAEGSFKVSYTSADWAKLDKERLIKRESHEYRIPCRHALSFRTSPNGVKSEYNKRRGSTTLYSKGQKIYVYNPVSKQTKYLMTLTSSTQPIIVPMSFCSY